jgi:hypothetical protein
LRKAALQYAERFIKEGVLNEGEDEDIIELVTQ